MYLMQHDDLARDEQPSSDARRPAVCCKSAWTSVGAVQI